LLNVHFTYFDIPAARTITTESIVCIKRPADQPGDQVAVEVIVEQRLRVGYIEMLDQAHAFADRGDYSETRRVFHRDARIVGNSTFFRDGALNG